MNKIEEKLEKMLNYKLLGKELAIFVVCLLVYVYFTVFLEYTILKHDAFRSYAWDLGIFNQSLWTTLKERRFFYHTLELFLNPSGSFFGVHFSPVLFLVLPIYALYPKPETLLALQSLILALAAFPLYLLAKEKFKKSRLLALILVVCYLLYPPLHGVNWFDFHVQSFLPLFVFSALYFFEKRNWKGYFLFVVLTLMVEEQVAIILVFWGIYLLWVFRSKIWKSLKEKEIRNKTILIPIFTILLSICWFTAVRYIKAACFPINPEYSKEYKALWNWSILGIKDDPLSLPVYILLNPLQITEALSFEFPLKFVFIICLFAPLAFLPFRTSSVTISFAWLVPALLSNNSFYYKLGYQYPAYIIPFLFYAAIQGINKVSKGDIKVAISVSKILLIVTLIFTVSLSPISSFPKIFDPEYLPPAITSHEELLHDVIALIPPNASVLTQNNIFPHLSCRSNIYAVFPHAAWLQVKKKIFDFTTNVTTGVEYILVDLSTDFSAFEYALERAKDSNYGVYASADKIVLFKMNYTGIPIIYKPLSELHNFSTLKISYGTIIEDKSSKSGRVLFHSIKNESSRFFWFGPYTPLPPGNYLATLRLKAEDMGEGDILTIDVVANGGKIMLSYQTINLKDFKYLNCWQNFTLNFELENPTADIEIRGMNLNTTNLYLDYVEIQQVTCTKDLS